MRLEKYRELAAQAKPRSKWKAVTADCGAGHSHPSRREAARCTELHMLQKVGRISDLVVSPQFWFVIDGRQVKLSNGRRAGYTADFRYTEGGLDVVEESKPLRKAARSRDYELRVAFFRALFPHLTFREVA